MPDAAATTAGIVWIGGIAVMMWHLLIAGLDARESEL